MRKFKPDSLNRKMRDRAFKEVVKKKGPTARVPENSGPPRTITIMPSPVPGGGSTLPKPAPRPERNYPPKYNMADDNRVINVSKGDLERIKRRKNRLNPDRTNRKGVMR